ncbi:AAA family ATPase [Helicobacter ailurogastricus]|uniref:ATPase AAA-type core domain-containing protein n=1 Tax=Helicobacter ailurogastricus TaxID=1578720 RepID=A0A0K2Y5P3_9HELI|nr:AAA family ATPase [Helicobacter ailurogastricus]BDQ28763.1 hypothetical protein ASB7_06000 [Helicobacter ailurogastricus]CRI32292.1 hypothetical protein HAL07_07670 [Helicobacter ailurogastricus]
MINFIQIENFKSIQKEVFELRPLTCFTGTNSVGKSSVLQTILLASYYNHNNIWLRGAIDFIMDYASIKNNEIKAKESRLLLRKDQQQAELVCSRDQLWHFEGTPLDLVFEENLFYLWSNRIGQQSQAKSQKDVKFGIDGEYAFAYYHDNRQTLDQDLYHDMQEILETNLELFTEKIGDYVRVAFRKSGTASPFSPFNVGAGVSYVAKILIMALSLKENDIFLIENPEIHLHPKAIANLASFFAKLVARKKIQLIIETHSAYFLHKLRHEVYKKNLSSDAVRFFYKDQPNKSFEVIDIGAGGRLVDPNKEPINFPTGFLDVGLDELLEIM